MARQSARAVREQERQARHQARVAREQQRQSVPSIPASKRYTVVVADAANPQGFKIELATDNEEDARHRALSKHGEMNNASAARVLQVTPVTGDSNISAGGTVVSGGVFNSSGGFQG